MFMGSDEWGQEFCHGVYACEQCDVCAHTHVCVGMVGNNRTCDEKGKLE